MSAAKLSTRREEAGLTDRKSLSVLFGADETDLLTSGTLESSRRSR